MEIQRLETVTRLGLYDCDLSPDGQVVAAVYQEDDGYCLGLWSTVGCSQLQDIPLPAAYARPRFDPDGRQLAAVRGSERLTAWSVAEGRVIFEVGRNGGAEITAHAFGPRGLTVAIAHGDSVSFWHVETGRWLASVPMPGRVRSLRASGDGHLLGVGLEAGGAVVVDGEGTRVVATLPAIHQPVSALSFHPHQPWLLTATAPSFTRTGSRLQRTEHGWAELWNYATGVSLARVPCDYQAVLLGEGRFVANLTNNSRSLWVWQVPETRLVAHIENAVPELLIDERGHEERRATLAATPRGDLLAVAGLTRSISAAGVLRLFAFHAEAVPQP